MDPLLIDLLEPAVIFGTLLGVAFGVKFLVWGKGPIKRLKGTASQAELERRVAELEERWEQWSELTAQQADQIAEVEERLDFAERLLTRQRAEQSRALDRPE
jgi:hypothetical protein